MIYLYLFITFFAFQILYIKFLLFSALGIQE